MSDYFDEMGWRPLADGELPDHAAHMARLFRDYRIFLEETDQQPAPPASKKAVEELPEEKITSEGKQCNICLKAYEIDEIIKTMPCKHYFHKECIEMWLTKTNSCPLCRHELVTDSETYELYKQEKVRAKQRELELAELHNSMFS